MSEGTVELPFALARRPELDAWLRLEADGTLTVFTGKVEIGQGIRTALARIAAEELDLELERVQVVTADTARTPNELYTAGSMSVETSGAALRQAAAEARHRLLELAAMKLGAPLEMLEVNGGVVYAPDRSRASYVELLGGQPFGRRATGAVRPKPPDRYRLVGKRGGGRLDLPAKVVGAPVFVHDLELEGMLHARVARPPSRHARLLSLDDAPVRALPGVVAVVRDGDFLAAAAEREEQAVRAAAALRAASTWEEEETLPEQGSIFGALAAGAGETLLVVAGVPGDDPIPPDAPPAGARRTLRATYERPYVMHASLGPSAAAAHLDGGQLTVWTHSQGVFPLRASLAQVLRREDSSIRVIHVEGAGCYGHNGADDAALDAALVARALPGRPVLLKWSREDEHAWEPYAPAMRVSLRASLDADAAVVGWSHDVWSNTHMGRPLPFVEASNLLAAGHLERAWARPPGRPSRGYHAGIHRNADPLYAFPQRRIVKHFVRDAPLRTSSTRGLGAFANVFAIESFMDELAVAAGDDPVAFRLRHLDDARARAVIEAAAERAGWGGESGDNGRGRGIGFARYKNQQCYAAVVVALRVEGGGAIRLERAVIAADAGCVVDPDGLANQLEGGFVQAASWTLKEEVRFDRRRVTSVDWDSYPILTFPEVPEIETLLLDHPHEPSLGAGEAAQGPTPAAIANALCHATGARVRRLPLTPDRVRAAVEEQS